MHQAAAAALEHHSKRQLPHQLVATCGVESRRGLPVLVVVVEQQHRDSHQELVAGLG